MDHGREKEGEVKVLVQGPQTWEGGYSNVVPVKPGERVERRFRRQSEVVEGGSVGGHGGETGHVLPLVGGGGGGTFEGVVFAVVERCGGAAAGGVRRRF